MRHGLFAAYALVCLAAIVQFMPALVAALYWKRATAAGVLAGCSRGACSRSP